MNQTIWRILVAVSLIAILQLACGQRDSRIRLDGYSMEPNFSEGQIFTIVETPLADLKRGDLVVVETSETVIIKRLIGLPNETISIHNGNVFINGTVLVEEYEVVPPSYTVDDVTLGSDSYFILGDNRLDSVDSHSFGPVKGSDIKGRAIP